MSSNLFADISEVTKEVIEGTKENDQLTGDVTQENDNEQDDTSTEESELAMLKSRAKMMGITFSPNIGLTALKEKVNDKLNETQSTTDTVIQGSQENIHLNQEHPKPETPETKRTPTLRQYLQQKHLALVRVRIANLDPKDSDLNGEYITVANEYLGTVTHFVPFGEITDDGWHLPRCIVEEIKSRKFLQLRTRGKGQDQTVEQNWVRKFSIEELPPLTAEELSRLAQAQLASGRLDKD